MSLITNTPTNVNKVSLEINTTGDTTIVTPAAGKALRILYFGYSGSGAMGTANVKVRWKFGANAYKDIQYITANQAFARGAGNGNFGYTGAVNEAFIVNLDIGQTVAVNVEYLEI